MTQPQTILQLTGSVWIAAVVSVALIMGYLSVNALMIIWMERKVSARMQRRLGPTERGPFGLLQTVFDMVKLLGKELLTPSHVNRALYLAAPVVVFAPVMAVCSLFPVTERWIFHDHSIAVVLVLAFGSFSVVGIFLAGWGSNNKFALLGAVRSVAQNVSYEIPLILAILPVVMMARSLSLVDITAAQASLPHVLVQPLAFLILLVAGTAETNRAPFDIPEAESELVGGFHTEYSGMRFGLFFFAEYSNMIIVAALAAVLFLGGWRGPLLPDVAWFFLKVYAIIFVMMWFRWTFPRVRFDQLMSFAWLVLVPLALANLLVTAIAIKVL